MSSGRGSVVVRDAACTDDPAELDVYARHDDPRVRALAAAHPSTPPDAMRRLARDEVDGVRANVASNVGTAPSLLTQLMADRCRMVRRRVLRRSDLTVEFLGEALRTPASAAAHERLTRMAVDPDVVRRLVAIGTPPALHIACGGTLTADTAAALLARQPELPWIVIPLLQNPTTPPTVAKDAVTLRPDLASLADPTSLASRTLWRHALRRGHVPLLAAMAALPDTPRIRLRLIWLRRRATPVARALAGNPATPPGLLVRLTRRQRWDVRARAAANPSLPADRLNTVMRLDADWAVQATALSTKRPVDPVTLSVLAMGHPAIAKLVAAHPDTTKDTLELLVHPRADPFVRAVALRHPSLGEARVRTLAAHLDQPAWALRSIAINPVCPPEVSEQLLTWVTIGGVPNSDPTFDPLTEVGHPGNTSIPYAQVIADLAKPEAACRHPLVAVRHAYASRPQIAPARLATLARDISPQIRWRAANFRYPSTAKELRDDPVPYVAEAARRMLSSDDVIKAAARDRRERIKYAAGGIASLLVIGTAVAFKLGTDPGTSTPPPISLDPGFMRELERMAASSLPPFIGDGVGGPAVLICTLPTGARLVAQSSVVRGAAATLTVVAGSSRLDAVDARASVEAGPVVVSPSTPLTVRAHRSTVLQFPGLRTTDASTIPEITGTLLIGPTEHAFSIDYPATPGHPLTGSCT